MQKGDIYHHCDFTYKNGTIGGRKYLILLNTPSESSRKRFLFCKTTAQQKQKLLSPGCQPEQQLFFIPGGQEYFPKNTWLQLYDIYEMDARSVLLDGLHKALEKVGELKNLTIRQLMNCIRKCKDIEIDYINIILKS